MSGIIRQELQSEKMGSPDGYNISRFLHLRLGRVSPYRSRFDVLRREIYGHTQMPPPAARGGDLIEESPERVADAE